MERKGICMDYRAKSIRSILKKLCIVTLILSLIFETPIMMKTSYAATSVAVVVDYSEETITLTETTDANSKFYMSTDNQKTWEMLNTNSDMKTSTVDISALLSSKEVTLYFKGNVDTAAVKFVIPMEDKNLSITYSVVGDSGQLTFVGATVQYKKGENGVWKTAISPMSTALYEIKGAKLFFRTAPTATTRASKVISVNIPKRPTAPSVKVDGGKFCITGLKPGVTQYRLGTDTTWIPFTTATNAKVLDLATLLKITTTNTPIPATTIEFRTNATAKKASSSVKVIEIPLQETLTGMASVSGTTITISDPNKKLSYEYAIVSKGSSLNLSTAKWKTISSSARPVIVPNASIDDTIYVRRKSYTDSLTKNVVLASTYLSFPVTSITPK